jgi:hypothetical protein
MRKAEQSPDRSGKAILGVGVLAASPTSGQGPPIGHAAGLSIAVSRWSHALTIVSTAWSRSRKISVPTAALRALQPPAPIEDRHLSTKR